ncbi:hypothetical protein D3C76_954270 [compost metagenome]
MACMLGNETWWLIRLPQVIFIMKYFDIFGPLTASESNASSVEATQPVQEACPGKQFAP